MFLRKNTISSIFDSQIKPAILSEIELAKSLKKPFFNYSSKFKEITSNDVFFKYICTLLNSNPRIGSDLQVLCYYLSHSSGITNLISEDNENTSDLLTQIAMEMKYEYHGSNSLLFKRGDIGENFYLLIKGKVAVLVVEEKSIYLSQEEYMVYLINLRKYKEYDLLHNSINQNSGLFKFQEDFLHWIENVNSPNKVKINQDYSITLSIVLGNAVSYIENGYKDNNLTVEEYIKRIAFETFDDEIVERRKITVYSYKKVVELVEGDKFGEASMLKDMKIRNASIITLEDCHFAILDKKGFLKCLSEITEKSKKATLDFFLTNQAIFRGVDCRRFNLKFMNFFLFHNCSNKKIIQENDVLNNIYFLKSGDFQISFRSSLSTLNEMIKNLGGPFKENHENRKLFEDEKYVKFMKEKRNIRVTIIKNNDVLGLDDMTKDNISLYNVKCLSVKGEFYTIEKKLFQTICDMSMITLGNYKNYLKKKKEHMVERLLAINNSFMSIYDKNKQMLDKEFNIKFEGKKGKSLELPSLKLIKKSEYRKNLKKAIINKNDKCGFRLNKESSVIYDEIFNKYRSTSQNTLISINKEKEKLNNNQSRQVKIDMDYIKNDKNTLKTTKECTEEENNSNIIYANNFNKSVSVNKKNSCLNVKFMMINEKKEIIDAPIEGNSQKTVKFDNGKTKIMTITDLTTINSEINSSSNRHSYIKLNSKLMKNDNQLPEVLTKRLNVINEDLKKKSYSKDSRVKNIKIIDGLDQEIF